VGQGAERWAATTRISRRLSEFSAGSAAISFAVGLAIFSSVSHCSRVPQVRKVARTVIESPACPTF